MNEWIISEQKKMQIFIKMVTARQTYNTSHIWIPQERELEINYIRDPSVLLFIDQHLQDSTDLCPLAACRRETSGEGDLWPSLDSPHPVSQTFTLRSCVNPFRMKTPKYLFSEEKTSILSSNWQHKFLYFHYKSVILNVLCRQSKIWTFGLPFRSKKFPICTQNSDLQSLYMLPIWGFAYYFA